MNGEKKNMAIRITADLDTKDSFKIAESIFRSLSTIKKIESIELEPSNSKGWHLIIWTKQNYSLKQTFNIRKKIGDDPSRIRLDKIRKIGRNTLFDKKLPPLK